MTRVRLVAIAKNEGAYLPEWIFHHRHFGFGDIEVLVNQTTDNTNEVAERLKDLDGLRFINIDGLLDAGYPLPLQITAYRQAYERAVAAGVSHLLFLDLDEYWTPRDFQSSIQSLLAAQSAADVIVFPWYVPKDDTEAFSPTYRAQQELYANQLVKSIFKLSMEISRIGVHIPESSNPDTRFFTSSGEALPTNPGPKPLPHNRCQSIPPAFVLHRMWRSPLEYVYRLGEGMRQAYSRNEQSPVLKTNRRGYGKATGNKPTSLTIPAMAYAEYSSSYARFLSAHDLHAPLEKARARIRARLPEVVTLLLSLENQNPSRSNELLARINKDLLLANPSAWLNSPPRQQVSD